MRGKIVNLCIGFANILFGILIIIFTTKVPQDKTLLTIQEGTVVKYILFGIYLVLGCMTTINVIQYYNHRRDTEFNIAYTIGIFALSFIFIKEPLISIFSIVSGTAIVIKSLKENLVEIDSTTAISVTAGIMIVTAILGLLSFSYASLGESIKDKENKNETAYKEGYFKYITELEDEYDPAFINVKRDGKYGYITENGNLAIDFEYDYASPFVNITMYNKNFKIALVCKEGSSYIILKNKREVLSYRSESADDNYKAKLEELENIYTNTLGQTTPMEYEIENITNHINKVPAYKEISSDYTFRYDYNDEYDLIVIQSNLGLGDKYELAKKQDLNMRISLETTDLDYDSEYLYLFSNGDIPYYEVSKMYQGWFTSYGKKNEMRGRAQILDFFGDKILIRNYNDKTVYFSDSAGNPVSEIYRDIFICNNNRYIVKTNIDETIKLIDGNLNKVFEPEYDIINTRLTSKNLYLCMNIEDNIKFNDYGFAKMNFILVNDYGEVVLDNIEQVYDEYFKLPEDIEKAKDKYDAFEEDLKDLKYNFVGDKFYSIYNK